jgi:ferritin-like protein
LTLTRRGFLQIGSTTVLTSVALAACNASTHRDTASTTTTVPQEAPDIALLRLGSSIEHLLVQAYMTAVGSGVVKTPELDQMIRYFADHHTDHANAMDGRTRALGGPPFTTANPAVLAGIRDRLDGLAAERDVLTLAYDLESMAAATFLSMVGQFTDAKLDQFMCTVGAIEARHLAEFGISLSGLPGALPGIPSVPDHPPYPRRGAFQTADGAIPPGTGI